MLEIPLGGDATPDKGNAHVTQREPSKPGTVASEYAAGNIDPKPGIDPHSYWSTVGQLTSQTPITRPSNYLTATFSAAAPEHNVRETGLYPHKSVTRIADEHNLLRVVRTGLDMATDVERELQHEAERRERRYAKYDRRFRVQHYTGTLNLIRTVEVDDELIQLANPGVRITPGYPLWCTHITPAVAECYTSGDTIQVRVYISDSARNTLKPNLRPIATVTTSNHREYVEHLLWQCCQWVEGHWTRFTGVMGEDGKVRPNQLTRTAPHLYGWLATVRRAAESLATDGHAKIVVHDAAMWWSAKADDTSKKLTRGTLIEPGGKITKKAVPLASDPLPVPAGIDDVPAPGDNDE